MHFVVTRAARAWCSAHGTPSRNDTFPAPHQGHGDPGRAETVTWTPYPKTHACPPEVTHSAGACSAEHASYCSSVSYYGAQALGCMASVAVSHGLSCSEARGVPNSL